MAIVYFDASALVKLVVDEDDTSVAVRLWDGCDAALSSRLAYAEVCGALVSAHRQGHLAEDALHAALDDFDLFWAAVRPVELTAPAELNAGRLAVEMGLSGSQAAHLACALLVQDPHLVMAVWDRKLAAAALSAGLAVSPPPPP